MQKYIYLLVVLLIANISGLGASRYNSRCPQVQPQRDFQQSRFSGNWYEIETIPDMSGARNGVKCAYETFKTGYYNSMSLILNGKETLDGTLLSRIGSLHSFNPRNRGQMTLIFPMDPRRVQYNVIATDYDNYALVYSCQYFRGQRKELGQIMSRSKTLDDSAVDKLKAILRPYGVDITTFQATDQTLC